MPLVEEVLRSQAGGRGWDPERVCKGRARSLGEAMIFCLFED